MSEDCDLWSVGCTVENVTGGVVSKVAGGGLREIADSITEGFGEVVGAAATGWAFIPTPTIAEGRTNPHGYSPPVTNEMEQVLGYMQWIGAFVAALSLIWLAALIAIKVRRGEGVAAVGKIGIVLGAVVVISSAGAVAGALMGGLDIRVGGTVGFLQGSTWMWTGVALMVGLIVGGIRMAWEHRIDPAKDVAKGILTLIVVTSLGALVIGVLVSAADTFSSWIIATSLNCDNQVSDGACFGSNLATLVPLASAAGGGVMLTIIFGFIAVLTLMTQVILLVGRYAMLIILTGLLPVTAAFSTTETGRQWFKRHIAWLVAFILYKPAAAIIYATAFQLLGQDVFNGDGSELIAVLAGLILMVLAVVALPAMMRFVTPVMSSMSGGVGSGGAGAAAVAAIPSGAMAMGRLRSGGGSGAGSSGAQGGAGPSGSNGASGAKAQTASGATNNGAAPGGAARGAAGGAAGGGAAAGAAGGGAAAGAAGGGAAAGAAAGPWGAAAGAAVDAGKKAHGAVKGAAEGVAGQVTQEGDGPSGSK